MILASINKQLFHKSTAYPPQLPRIILQTIKGFPKRIPSHSPPEFSATCAFAIGTTRKATIIVTTYVRSLESTEIDAMFRFLWKRPSVEGVK